MTTYSTGTISVGAGSTSVTGVGTNWMTAGIRAGDRLIAAGLVGIVASVGSATSITLKRAWPGAALSGANYDIEMVDDGVRSLVAANTLLQALGAGTLTSLGALSSGANKMPYWSGAGVMAMTDLTAAARTLLDDASVSDMRTTLGLVLSASALDTTAGRLTQTGAYGWGAAGAAVPNNNVDDITVSGSYQITSTVVSTSTAISAIATSGSGFLHLAFDSNSAAQIMVHRTTGVTWIRTKSVGAWGTFRPLVEGGSNGNGRFTRFADGRMICTHTLTASSGAATTWTFPATFAEAPFVDGSIQATVLSAFVRDGAPTTTTATFSARDKADARRADSVSLIAVGRWF